jgi:dTDP-4-dehydrorhamnose reductase
MKTILITGADGMLAKDAAEVFLRAGYSVIKATKTELDVTNFAQVEDFFADKCAQNKIAKNKIAQNKIDFVLHAAAYTKVDDAESNQDLAFLINSTGAKNVAIVSSQHQIPIIYISTDYVFDGEKGAPYLPSDKPNPINVYGASKLAGEENVKKENPMHYIARTNWLYGKHGKNFVDTMLELAKTKTEIKVVNDQIGCPTSTIDLALALKKLIENKMPFGTYHLCGGGFASWFDFAKKIFEIAKIEIEVLPVNTSQFPRPAKRPKFSAMENGGLVEGWEGGLKNYLDI